MPYQPRTQRILACHFTRLPTDRIFRQRRGKSWRIDGKNDTLHELPLVVTDTIKNAVRIVAMAQDRRLGDICVGQTLSDARAIVPTLDCVEHDPHADQALLAQIARWCERYTPLVTPSSEDSLFLNITGCTHLFGSEQVMLEDLDTRLIAQGFSARLAIADTAGAAWALAHYSDCTSAPPGTHELLDALPLEALRLSREKAGELGKLGVKTISCLANLPRAPVTARFGREVLVRLDQALGREDEVLSLLQPIAELVHEKRFAEPIAHEDDIRASILLLAENLARRLEKRGLGMRQAKLQLFRVDGEVVFLEVAASTPVRDARRMAALFDERLVHLHDEWDAGFGFDVIQFSIVQGERLDIRQEDMVTDAAPTQAVAHLVDRLSARLGADRVQICQVADTHIPERRLALSPAVHCKAQTGLQNVAAIATRPLLLLQYPEIAEVMAEVPEGPPIRFRWRNARYEISRSEGPERIACEWWKDGRAAHTRDYFRIETQDGYRLWLFRHGLYARETNAPRWYVHGIFG